MKLTVTSTAGDFVTLCECKEYLKVNDESRDDLILNCSKMATRFVEDMINESLSSHTVQLITDVDHIFELYLPAIDVINSVKCLITGEDVSYRQYADNQVIALDESISAIIDYTTKKKEVDADAEKMAVLALTSLIYDGVTDRNVWNSVINNYLAHKLPL